MEKKNFLSCPFIGDIIKISFQLLYISVLPYIRIMNLGIQKPEEKSFLKLKMLFAGVNMYFYFQFHKDLMKNTFSRVFNIHCFIRDLQCFH